MSRGRSRRFDLEQALEMARDVFWRRGYDGTSLADLLAALGIGAGSFYAAFGSKQALFEQVARRYAQERIASQRRALTDPDPAGALDRLVGDSVDAFTADPRRPGCFFQCSRGGSEGIGGSIWRGYRMEALADLAAYFAAGKGRWGHFSHPAEPGRLALAVMVLLDGIAAQAAAGTPRSDLMAVAHAVLPGLLVDVIAGRPRLPRHLAVHSLSRSVKPSCTMEIPTVSPTVKGEGVTGAETSKVP